MKTPGAQSLPLSLFTPPYHLLEPLRWDDRRFAQPNSPGTGLVWQLRLGSWSCVFEVVRRRPPGMTLIVILPASVDLDSDARAATGSRGMPPSQHFAFPSRASR